MAITPNSYPFSGGAFMGGGGSPVNRDDIHTLNLTKNGESIGNYNPLVGDADVDIPSDAVVISFSTFSGTMPGSAYSKMASAVGAGQVVMLRSVSGAPVVYWTLLAASVLSYKFISVSETAVLTVEIQTSGDSSGNHAFTISNVPLTELRVIDTGASSGDDRGHEHTRIAEALAAGKTVCIKYTSGNNIAYGTLCGAHDGHYTFIVDYGGTPSVLTVIADGSMQISAIFDGDASEFSVTPDGSSTGYNITGPTLLKVFLQKFKNLVGALKALAFKDKVSDSDISGTISDGHIASASTWDGKQDSLGISASGDEDKYLNQKGSFTMPTYLNTPRLANTTDADTLTSSRTSRIVEEEGTPTNNLPDNSSWWYLFSMQGQDNKYAAQLALGMTTTSVQYRRKDNNVWSSWNNLRDASWINSGTFGTDRIADDAITADKVKDAETLPVNINGSASQLSHVTSNNEASTWRQIAKLESSDANRVLTQGFVVAVREHINDNNLYTGTYIVSCTSKGSDCKILQGTRIASAYEIEFVVAVASDSITLYAKSGSYSPYHVTALFGNPTISIGSALGSKPAGIDVAKTFLVETSGQVGSPTTPIYVNPNGQMQPCDVLSGGTTNFNRTFTTSYTVGSTDQYITTAIKNGNIDLIADYVAWHNAHADKLSSPPMIIITLSARTAISNAGLITLNMYKNGNGCDVFGEKYAYMGNQHDSQAYNTQYFTDQTFVSGSAYYLNIRNETPNTMWTAGTILDISIRIVAHAVSVT